MSLKSEALDKAMLEIVEGGKEHQEMQIAMGIQKMAQNLEGFSGAIEQYRKQYPTFQVLEMEGETFPGFVSSIHSVKRMFEEILESCDGLLKDMHVDKEVAPEAVETVEGAVDGQ
jgi:hypothetical protein